MKYHRATDEQLALAVKRFGVRRAGLELRRRGLLPPIAGASGLTIDASTPAITITTTNVLSQASGIFLPPANSLLVPVIGGPVNNYGVASITDNLGTHLTYTKKVAHAGTSFTSQDIWLADSGATAPSNTVATLSAALSTGTPITSLPVNALAAALPAGTIQTVSGGNTQTWTTTGAAASATSIPVTSQTPNFAYPSGSTVVGFFLTATFNNSMKAMVGVLVFTGAAAAASQTGATATGDPASPPSITVPGTSSGSFVIAVFGDSATGNTPTPASGQTITFNGNSYFFSDGGAGGDGCWVQTTTATTGGGSVTLNDTAPLDSTHVAAAEILAAGGGGAATPLLYSPCLGPAM